MCVCVCGGVDSIGARDSKCKLSVIYPILDEKFIRARVKGRYKVEDKDS